MKIKKFNKKLGLNKSTVANLSGQEMNLLHGGGTTTLVGHACSAPCVSDICYTKQVPTCSATVATECYC
jgi:natural product precursor